MTSKIPEREEEHPWMLNQCISFQIPLPKLAFLQEGWKEIDHSEITKIKNKIANFTEGNPLSLEQGVNPKNTEEEWELRKKIMNPYEAIFSGTEDNSFPSLANVQPLSRSYFKMIEILHLCSFWEQDIYSFSSAHICEGPGGFLQHVVEKAKKKNLHIKSLFAITLKPTKSHIPGWRRSIHFLKNHAEINLEYGEDGTGNILDSNNQKHFVKRAQNVLLFTADGGFDFSVDYTKQEEAVFSLLLASFTMGLQTLRRGGTIVIKLFDMYSKATQDLLIGTATFFKKFTIYKPATSRPCNSERYFIASGYEGSEKSIQWIHHLQLAQVKHVQSPLTRLIDISDREWPSEILEAFQEQIKYQQEEQINAIFNTLHFNVSDLHELVRTNITKSTEWCKMFDVPYKQTPLT